MKNSYLENLVDEFLKIMEEFRLKKTLIIINENETKRV